MIPVVIDTSRGQVDRMFSINVGDYSVVVRAPWGQWQPLMSAANAIEEHLGIGIHRDEAIWGVLRDLRHSFPWYEVKNRMWDEGRWMKGGNHICYGSLRDVVRIGRELGFVRDRECKRCERVTWIFRRRFGLGNCTVRTAQRYRRLTHPRCRFVLKYKALIGGWCPQFHKTSRGCRQEFVMPGWFDWDLFQAHVELEKCRTLLRKAKRAVRGEYDEYTSNDDCREDQVQGTEVGKGGPSRRDVSGDPHGQVQGDCP